MRNADGDVYFFDKTKNSGPESHLETMVVVRIENLVSAHVKIAVACWMGERSWKHRVASSLNVTNPTSNLPELSMVSQICEEVFSGLREMNGRWVSGKEVGQ